MLDNIDRPHSDELFFRGVDAGFEPIISEIINIKNLKINNLI